jgi:hypothetical protein
LQDVFTIIPVLLNCNRVFADGFLYSLGDQCSAKEAVIALQEATETLIDSLSSGHPVSDSEEEEITPEEEEASIPQQSIRIIQMYVHGTRW